MNFGSISQCQMHKKLAYQNSISAKILAMLENNYFFVIAWFPSITCPICNSLDANRWLHVLLKFNHHYIHALRVKRHNKSIWGFRKLTIKSQKLRCYTFVNTSTLNNNPRENKVPPWLLPCTSGWQRCHCNAKFKPYILCVERLRY